MPTVVSVTPANGATRVANDQSVQVELTRADSTDYTKVETSQADFAAGTLVNVQARGSNDLALADPVVDNFDSDTIGQLPSGWDVQFGTGFSVQSGLTSKALYHAGTSPSRNGIRWTAQGQIADVDLKVQWKIDATGSWSGLVARLSGGSGTETYYCLRVNALSTTIGIMRLISGTPTGLGTFDFPVSAGAVYWMRLQVVGTTIRGRAWASGDDEPAAWGISVTDSSIATGYVGLLGYSPQGTWWDFFTILPLSGSRVSPAYALSTVGKFGAGVVQYDATVPDDATLALKISKDGSNWTTVASGDHIALWADGDSLASEHIYTKTELTPSGTAVTPVLSEVRLIFMAIDAALVEITVDSLSFKLANSNLEVWNTAKVTAGPVIVDPCTQDLFLATRGQWYAYGGRSYTVLVKYAGATLSTTTFTNEHCETYAAWLPFSFLTQVGGGLYDGPMSAWLKFFVGAFEDINLVRGEFHYLVQEIVRQGMDARYWVAHVYTWDTPVSGVVGQPVPNDTPLSGVVRGWLLGDTAASGIVQGWMWDDTPLSGVFALPISHDEAASGIVGLPIETAGALSGVVYEVNANNVVELRVISVAEAAALTALGIVIQ